MPVLVKQSRPTVYAGEVGLFYQVSLAAKDQDRSWSCRRQGVTVKLCTILVDQLGLMLEEVACKEAWEECGCHLAPLIGTQLLRASLVLHLPTLQPDHVPCREDRQSALPYL